LGGLRAFGHSENARCCLHDDHRAGTGLDRDIQPAIVTSAEARTQRDHLH
jgi:hypothetical protein